MRESFGTCRLCLQESQLSDSHIVPKFVFKWLKATGGTDYLRFGGEPNRRVQDGLKHKLMCTKCEQHLSDLEKRFSEQVFKKITSGSYPRGQYSSWFSKFAASLVWRVGQSQDFRGVLYKADDKDVQKIRQALEIWRKFILGQERHPGPFELHFVPIGGLSNIEHPDVPDNWNRYSLRQVEFDTVYTDGSNFLSLYCKIGPVAFFGFVQNNTQPWKGSRISVNHGFFERDKLVWPPFLLKYFFSRARFSKELMSNISPKQRARTDQEILKNLERVRESDLFSALLLDGERFGLDAIVHDSPKKR